MTQVSLSSPELPKSATLHPLWWLIKQYRSFVFYLVFFVVYCFSGLLTILSLWLGFSYRMGLITVLIVPLVIFFKKRPIIVLLYLFLTVIVVVSGLFNSSSVLDVLLFMRTLVFSYLIYQLTDVYLKPSNMIRVIRLCITVAMIQFPIIVAQRLAYPYLPTWITRHVVFIDFSFGSFNFKTDAAMVFFITSLITFLLFEQKRSYFVKHYWLVLIWLTLTVLVSNAEVGKIILVFVWASYLLTHFRLRRVLSVILLFCFLLAIMGALGLLEETWSGFSKQFSNNISTSKSQAFISGNYSRGAAIAYYLNRSLLLLGDGPSRYYNALNRSFSLGNHAHILTFYSEIGILGWLTSVAIFLLMAFPLYGPLRRNSLLNWSLFISVQILSLTTQIMSDIGVVLILCIVARCYLIPVRLPERPHSTGGKANGD